MRSINDTRADTASLTPVRRLFSPFAAVNTFLSSENAVPVPRGVPEEIDSARTRADSQLRNFSTLARQREKVGLWGAKRKLYPLPTSLKIQCFHLFSAHRVSRFASALTDINKQDLHTLLLNREILRAYIYTYLGYLYLHYRDAAIFFISELRKKMIYTRLIYSTHSHTQYEIFILLVFFYFVLITRPAINGSQT